jgi:hypothetical protein
LRQIQAQGFGYAQAVVKDEQKQAAISRCIAAIFGGGNQLFDFMAGKVFWSSISFCLMLDAFYTAKRKGLAYFYAMISIHTFEAFKSLIFRACVFVAKLTLCEKQMSKKIKSSLVPSIVIIMIFYVKLATLLRVYIKLPVTIKTL